jgi:hypothetical protein
MLSVNYKPFMLSVPYKSFMLSVVMLNVIMPSIVAPYTISTNGQKPRIAHLFIQTEPSGIHKTFHYNLIVILNRRVP